LIYISNNLNFYLIGLPMRNVFRQGRIFAALSLALTTISANALTQQNVDNIIKPLMKQQQIPGMSVAIS
ncbi:hypothetical protein CGH73_28615, partial [Vibrio parahaemolyticus]